MPEPTVLSPTVRFAGRECRAYLTRYPANGAPAIYLDDAEDESPVAVATVNVPGVTEALDGGRVLIKDYSENEGMLAALVFAGLVEDTKERFPVGYASVAVARLIGA